MSHLSPQEPTSSSGFVLKHTNVSNPSIIEHKPSLQSVTASEHYYSLSNSDGSGSSTYSGDSRRLQAAAASSNTIHRYTTPPSRYRTPAQSRDSLAQALEGAGAGAGGDGGGGEEVRKTPMRGQGKRRQSVGEGGVAGSSTAGDVGAGAGAQVLREGGVRRKPVPSTVMERNSAGQSLEGGQIDPTHARSSVARDLEREQSPSTPGVDDTPFIRFALDQLTRDEEVRGSRRYRDLVSGVEGNDPYLAPAHGAVGGEGAEAGVVRDGEQGPQLQRQPLPEDWQEGRPPSEGVAGASIPPFAFEQSEQKARLKAPPPRNPRRISELPANKAAQPLHERQQRLPQQQQHQPSDTRFLPVSSDSHTQQPLNFLPGILRPTRLLLFLILLLAFLACLLFCAIYSLSHAGIWDYGAFGDGRYFLFQYLPTLLGILLLFWTIQLEVAVYRIAPFIAMASASPREREAGAKLPMVPRGFVLPYFGHWKAKQGAIAFFVFVAWAQIWTIPLLASSFNVYFDGAPTSGRWMWIATQGAIWTVITLYLLLALAVLVLLGFLKFGRRTTGLEWDPRSLADVVVLLERSNALDGVESEGQEPPQLGHWRTNARPNDVFHAYGVADKEARSYSLEDGRIREKAPAPAPAPAPFQPPISRFSADPEDVERGSQRHSREKMLPKSALEGSGSDDTSRTGSLVGKQGAALPWFLHPSAAALWAIIAFVLLLAFLIVSYLPSTRVSAGFNPDVPAPVNTMGFSGTNFLYSFVPALLGTLCWLFWLDVDYAYRRLQVFEALAQENQNGGELAERTLLLSYPAELPGLATATAAVNGHYRVAALSFVSLLASALPILAGGVFWAQFYVPTQRTRISAHMPAYYALTAFVTIYALAFGLIFPSKALRRACALMERNPASSFSDLVQLVRSSRMLDDVAFRCPLSKTVLVTRLVGAAPGTRVSALQQHAQEEGMASKVSLADSVRGFGKARQQALGGLGMMGVNRYSLGRHVGRDGGEFVGVDRVGG